MKFILLSALAVGLSFSVAASANDGGTPYIKVRTIKSSVKKGQTMTVKGGEAYKLYSVLPRDFVYDVSRSLTITSDKQAITIGCHAQPKDKHAQTPTPNLATAECTISIEDAFNINDEGANPMPWQPVCK